MILEKKAGDLHKYTEEQHKTKLKVGFVPTMGALHAGHISLIKKSISENDITICSIFINPAQFNDPNDFSKYPVTIEQDIFQVETSGCNLLFLPSVEEIYPKETEAGQHYNLGYIETILEGKFRPGHFMGVCKVMERLLRIVEPDNLYLGQKDYQQCMVIKQLITDLKLDKKINLRLNEQERKDATAIYHTLLYIKDQIHKNEIPEIKRAAEKILTEKGFLVDYVELADANTLKPINRWDGDTIIVVLIAAFMNNVRLIDNMTIN